MENNIEIFVSVDGGKEIHNKHRKLKNGVGSWEIVKDNLLKALKRVKILVLE